MLNENEVRKLLKTHDSIRMDKKIFFENAAHFFEKVLQPRRVML